MFIYQHIIEKINFNTLAILFCLMGVVAGFQELGYLDALAQALTKKAKNLKILTVILVFSCFFLSMVVTNDVALILLVPFTIQILWDANQADKQLRIIVLETIAANLGSMLTPIGNPQNVYLYQQYQMQPGTFFRAVAPFAIASAVLLAFFIWLRKGHVPLHITTAAVSEKRMLPRKTKRQTTLYLFLFALCLGTVFGKIPCWLTFEIELITIGITNMRLLRQINYSLLLKFVFLFILVGNLADIAWIRQHLETLVTKNEFWMGITLSQILSNVPAAILLSDFTKDGISLLLGVNVGGLGTLIASMASMISFDFYTKTKGADKKRYICTFTVYNLIFLVCLIALFLILPLHH
ncbi:MAG: SLC13 family permease [Lachnospiraceae bacterium]